jgi:predicted dehydrogenase
MDQAVIGTHPVNLRPSAHRGKATCSRDRWRTGQEFDARMVPEMSDATGEHVASLTRSMPMSEVPVGIAIVGCGVVSEQYLRALGGYPDVRVVTCADLDPARARAAAERFGVPGHGDLDRVLADPDVELVVNLTPPAAHADVAVAAIEAGRHVYGEKPLALDRAAGRRVLAAATAQGVRVGSAPDTVLGRPMRTVVALLAEGAIGTPLAGTTRACGPGPDAWHPEPEPFFRYGGGPLFDLGPYHLSALVVALGPVAGVAALGHRARSTRVIGNGPRAGARFAVEVATQVSVLLEFASGAQGSAQFSFDTAVDQHGPLEICGTSGVIAAPDPNCYEGAVRSRRTRDGDWTVAHPVGLGPAERGVGVLDMARAIRSGEPHRASGEFALHIVDVMQAITESSARREFVPVTSRFAVPEPLPGDWDPRTATLSAAVQHR